MPPGAIPAASYFALNQMRKAFILIKSIWVDRELFVKPGLKSVPDIIHED
jgi:hypothetical protein